MDLKIKAMTILAIFCVLISAGSACAAEDIATNSDDVLSIDMDNNVESLNAGVAASILLYEMRNK